MTSRPQRILLVLDDEATVCRSLRRILGRTFDEVHTAETPADAETILESLPVTHLLLDQLLGPGQPLGNELAVRWRGLYPSIDNVVLLTGADVATLQIADEVDQVLPKTTELGELARALGSRPSSVE